MMFPQALQVSGFVVVGACFPAGVEDADPFISQRPYRSVVALSGFGFGFNKVARPVALEYRTFGKLDPGLVQELRFGWNVSR